MVRQKHSGFTLLELMIAMVIFSFMSIMAYGSLSNIFTADTVISEQEKKLKELKRAMMFIERDMRQLTLRPRRSGFTQKEAALVSGLDSEGIIEFTRSGNSNPLELVRSSLQRVRYSLEEGQLSRMSWNLVDHINAEPISIPLLSNVDSLTLRFLDASNEWKDNWSTGKQNPKAIEMTLEHKSWGEILRLFPVH